jgi:hypothetical protein
VRHRAVIDARLGIFVMRNVRRLPDASESMLNCCMRPVLNTVVESGAE